MTDRRVELRRELKALADDKLVRRYASARGVTLSDAKTLLATFPGWREIAIDVVVHHEAPR